MFDKNQKSSFKLRSLAQVKQEKEFHDKELSQSIFMDNLDHNKDQHKPDNLCATMTDWTLVHKSQNFENEQHDN